jgi:hypothetical protein
VKCRSCSAEIADKAIVCYRCGTPTAFTVPERAGRTAGGRRWPWLLVLAAAALALAAYLYF